MAERYPNIDSVERTDFWRKKAADAARGDVLQRLIRLCENESRVEKYMRELERVSARESAWRAQVLAGEARMQRSRRTTYCCPVCDSWAMFVVLERSEFSGNVSSDYDDDMCFEEWTCLACGYEQG
jgi:hypothetical protein